MSIPSLRLFPFPIFLLSLSSSFLCPCSYHDLAFYLALLSRPLSLIPSLSIPSLTLFIISLSSSFPNSHVLLLSLISFFLYLPPFPIICVLVFFVYLFFAVLYLYFSLTMPSIRSLPAIIISRKISDNATYIDRSSFQSKTRIFCQTFLCFWELRTGAVHKNDCSLIREKDYRAEAYLS